MVQFNVLDKTVHNLDTVQNLDRNHAMERGDAPDRGCCGAAEEDG